MQQTHTKSALLGVLCLTLFMGYVRAHGPDDEAETATEHESRIRIGLSISPVPLNLVKKNRALVGLGSYIVNAQGGCNDCHTNPPFAEGGDPFLGQPKHINQAGYLGGGVAFGPFVSRNLTPNRLGLPAGLTYERFAETMRTGRDLKNIPPAVPSEDVNLLQVMPWPVYGEMNDRDMRAVYEYLRAIPCVGSATRCTP